MKNALKGFSWLAKVWFQQGLRADFLLSGCCETFRLAHLDMIDHEILPKVEAKKFRRRWNRRIGSLRCCNHFHVHSHDHFNCRPQQVHFQITECTGRPFHFVNHAELLEDTNNVCFKSPSDLAQLLELSPLYVLLLRIYFLIFCHLNRFLNTKFWFDDRLLSLFSC